MSFPLFRQWLAHPPSQTLNVVNRVLAAHPDPLSTKEIYKLALEYAPTRPVVHELVQKREPATGKQPTRPPHPEHPIRSIRYLKTVVLPALEAQKKVEKVHIKRTLSESEIQQRRDSTTKAGRKAARTSIDSWVWRVPAVRPDIQSPAERPRSLLAAAVGFGNDWSHLNKRRRRARVMKVQRDLGVAKAVKRLEMEKAQIGKLETSVAVPNSSLAAEERPDTNPGST